MIERAYYIGGPLLQFFMLLSRRFGAWKKKKKFQKKCNAHIIYANINVIKKRFISND